MMNPTLILSIALLIITLLTVSLLHTESRIRHLKQDKRQLERSRDLLWIRLVDFEKQNRHLRQEQNRAIGARYRVEGQDIYTFWN